MGFKSLILSKADVSKAEDEEQVENLVKKIDTKLEQNISKYA